MKTQLKKILEDNSSSCSSLENPSFASSGIKFETINEATHEEVLQSSQYQTKFGRKIFSKQKSKSKSNRSFWKLLKVLHLQIH